MSDIKSMKLYNNVDRILNELHELGKKDSDSLIVEELSKFDQLHYYGTQAVDYSINAMKIDSSMTILDIGSGIGGPARYIAYKTGATVVALELQSDQNKLAVDLTKRCGLAEKVIHVCGNFLTQNWREKKFDAIVSWLSLYHIPEREILLKKCFDLLKLNGFFYTEDLISKRPLSKDDLSRVLLEIYGRYLPDYKTYISDVEKVGFNIVSCQDMSDEWTKFTNKRTISYSKNRDRQVRIHGKEIVNNLNSFYSFVDQYFSNGKLGGIRILAQKNPNTI